MIGSSASRGWCWPINSDESDYSRIAGPVGARGPTVEVEIRLHASELERYRIDNRIEPLPLRTTGIIDTAAQKTCIRTSTARGLLLEPVEQTTLATASGPVESAVYHLSLQFGLTLDQLPAPIPVFASAAPEVLGAELLIGLDVLRRGELTVYGPDDRYELILPRSTNHPRVR